MTDDPVLPPDPKPVPPEAPDLNACCGNGCDPCIFDLHDLAMAAYRQALKDWEARASQCKDDKRPGSGS